MQEAVIKVENLTKTYKLFESTKQRIIEGLFPFVKVNYNEFHALQDVSFDIKKGEIVGIIGKNGSGKSTLLKIITGVLKETSGSVNVSGRVSALLELGSGFNPEYTGIENIYMNGTLMGVTREEMSHRVQEIVDFADIGDFIYQPVKNYSSGMFVRLAFAVAINVDADILIVDEALAVGDVAFQAKCMAKMNQIMKKGTTILFVTHDMNTVKRLCQRCIYLENGKKIMEGPAEELADIYLKRIRASMNAEHIKFDQTADKQEKQEVDTSDINVLSDLDDKALENEEFMKRIALFREGTGDIEFIDLKLVDESGIETFSYPFNSTLNIKMLFRVKTDTELVVSYHIRDNKNMELLGSTTRRELGTTIDGKAGQVYEVTFKTKLPLLEGDYNVTSVASKAIIENRTALFLDYVENAAVFKVEEASRKLWDKVYIKNEAVVRRLK